MKKFFALILTLCMMASVLCIPASAEESTDVVVIRVAGMKENGQVILPETYTSFKDGWNRAAKLAQDYDWMDENGIVRVVVDLYDDWTASGTKFGSGEGFEHSAIRIPGNTSMMINMNGHTIDRGRTSDTHNGEVIFMGKNSDLIINGGQYRDTIVKVGEDPGYTKMGTIKGGFSCNGAGGIHMDGNGRLTLNNVHLKNNASEDDDGSVIAAYNNSVVIMNGGSIDSNKLHSPTLSVITSYGGVFLSNSYAELTDVELTENYITGERYNQGIVIYLKNSDMVMTNCNINKNGNQTSDTYKHPESLIRIDKNSSLTVKNCTFENNSTKGNGTSSTLIRVDGGTLKVTDSYFINNGSDDIIYSNLGFVDISTTEFRGNSSEVFQGSGKDGSHFTNCKFLGNNANGKSNAFSFGEANKLTFYTCDLGNSTFNDKSRATFVNCFSSDDARGVLDLSLLTSRLASASIFGEGSVTTIISLLALMVSVAAIGVSITSRKKKNTETDEEE